MAIEPVLAQLVADFVHEANGHVQRLTRLLLDLERSRSGAPAPEASYQDVARGLHTLKGSAATLGLVDLAALAHRMEDAFAPALAQQAGVSTELADALLNGLDAFISHVKAHAGGTKADRPLSEVLNPLNALLEGMPRAEQAPSPSPPQPTHPAPEMPAVDAEPDEQGSWRVNAQHVAALMMEMERMREARLRVDHTCRAVEKLLSGLSGPSASAQLGQHRTQVASVREALALEGVYLGQLVEDLDATIKAICTLPSRTLLDGLARSVRDAARATGKQAVLHMVGGEISLDRRVLEALKGPLLHLVRNAVDHGIEPPATRLARGKAEEGSISIRVEQQGNIAFLEVADDGGGLDVARIRHTALERGFATAEELAHVDDSQVMQFIFRNGFTTSAQVTAVSGRGVGLDAVRAAVQRLRGSVEVHTTPGQGTRFSLSVPTEIGTLPVLLVTAGGCTFGVPMLALDGVVPAHAASITLVRGENRMEYQEKLLPLFDLAALASLRQGMPNPEGQETLIIHAEGQRAAVMVDKVLTDLDLAIHPLPPELASQAAYQGAVILAGGELVAVLRPEWLVDADARARDVAASARRALVVDDSLAARALHRVVLESGGFAVHAVPSAREALERLGRTLYDVVVCDVGMADMDGLTFSRLLRDRGTTAHLPIVLVSAHDTAEDRAAGMAAGADAYLSKRECASGRLLSEVSAAMARRSQQKPAKG